MNEKFEHVFVDSVPSELDEGKLYVSMRFRSASHLCPCGCRVKIVTPIRPSQWHLYFNGDAVSLWPSIGNWQLECKSHYWIDRGVVRWSYQWSDEEIADGRNRDVREIERYYADRSQRPREALEEPPDGGSKKTPKSNRRPKRQVT